MNLIIILTAIRYLERIIIIIIIIKVETVEAEYRRRAYRREYQIIDKNNSKKDRMDYARSNEKEGDNKGMGWIYDGRLKMVSIHRYF